MEQKNTNTTLVIVIGIISIASLILSWTAYNRTGPDLEVMVTEQVEEAYRNTETTVTDGAQAIERETEELIDDTVLLAARAEARAELLAIETRVEAGAGLDEIQADLNAVEADLDQAYANAERAANQEWNDLQTNFQNMESSLRTNTAEALEFIGGAISLLEEDVRYDEDY